MPTTFDTGPITFGESVFLADNYDWDIHDVDSASRFEKLISQSRFPLYPDTLFIVICKKGEFKLTSGAETISAGPHDALIALGGYLIDDVEISPDCRIIFFNGKSKYFNTQIDLDDANRILRHALKDGHPFLFHLSAKEFHAVEGLYFSSKEILQLTEGQESSRVISGYAGIVSTLIAMRLKRQEINSSENSSLGSRVLLTDFIDNVRLYCRKERGISFYANLANLTPKYFSKQIKRLSGKSPGEIIEEFTMAEVKNLLSSKKYSVKEVSNLMNFSSPSSFCKYFKAAEGVPPGKYMK